MIEFQLSEVLNWKIFRNQGYSTHDSLNINIDRLTDT